MAQQVGINILMFGHFLNIFLNTQQQLNMSNSKNILTFILLSHECDEKLVDIISKFIYYSPTSCVLHVIDSGVPRNTLNENLTGCAANVRFFYGLNFGIYHAINQAINYVATEYYMVLGLDDNFNFNGMKNFVSKLERREIDLLFCGVIKNNKKLMYFRPEYTLKGPQGVFPSHTGGVAIRTNLHERFGKYDERFTVVADLFFLGKCMRGGVRVELHNEYLAEIGGSGFSKRHEFIAEIESMRVRVELGLPYFLSWMICVKRIAQRAIKRLLFRVIS